MLSTAGVVPVAHEFSFASCPGASGFEFSPVSPEWPIAMTPTGFADAEGEVELLTLAALGVSDATGEEALPEPEVEQAHTSATSEHAAGIPITRLAACRDAVTLAPLRDPWASTESRAGVPAPSRAATAWRTCLAGII
jgi:hypothetical protein